MKAIDVQFAIHHDEKFPGRQCDRRKVPDVRLFGIITEGIATQIDDLGATVLYFHPIRRAPRWFDDAPDVLAAHFAQLQLTMCCKRCAGQGST